MAKSRYKLTSDPQAVIAAAGFSLPLPQSVVAEALRYQHVQILQADEVTDISVMGTPVFHPFTFEDISYIEVRDGRRRQLKVPKMTIMAAIVTVNFRKKIIETDVQRQQVSGSFKEHINFGDYDISLKGLLCNDNAKYPMDLVRHLNEICKAPIAIDITHPILNNLGIYTAVIRGGGIIEDFNGKQNLQPFSIDMVSDYPRSLIIR